ncbi:SAC3/GANP/Nin1/mts3/eIF-3 p25 family-domain-containing protein, partial [Zopfochytrium polystomum]
MSDPTAKVALSDAIVFVGECEDMCPEFERHEREFQKGLHEFEKIEGTEFADHDRCVKRYRRSAAGDPVPMPCDVRPPRVLVKTLDYLLHTVIPERTLEAAQPFIRDRCRSIRNDFTLQNYRGIEAVECHERIARFHILSAFKFCNHPVISLQQEQEQMRKTLQSLREYYVDLRSTGIESLNEPEFHAYYILSHLWQNEVVSTLETILPPAIFSHPHIQLAIEFQQLAQCLTDTSTRARPPRCPGSLNFFTRFFRMCFAPTTPFLFACLLHQEFYAIRKAALRGMHT